MDGGQGEPHRQGPTDFGYQSGPSVTAKTPERRLKIGGVVRRPGSLLIVASNAAMSDCERKPLM
jgi:hypothetical protein